MSVRWAEVALLALLLAGHLEAEVTIRQASDKSVDVRAERYSARVDGQGNLVELVVVGAKSLTHQFGNPGKPPPEPPSVSVAGKAVVVQSGKGRVEWAFGEDAVHVVSEGYTFECRIDGSVKAVLAPGGRNGAFPHYAGGSTALVLCNDRMVAYSAMHVHENRFLPPGYTNGTKKPGDRIEFDLRLGALVDPIQLLTDLRLVGVVDTHAPLKEGGNQGQGLVHFADPAKIEFFTSQRNLHSTSFELDYRLSVLDHYVAGKEVASPKQPMTLAARGSADRRWKVPALAPGFYYATLSVWLGETKVTEARQTFAVDLASYRRSLTRPPDFADFWTRQEEKLKATPPNPVLKLVSAAANPDKAYEVTLDMPDGSKLRGCLAIPEKPGAAPAQLGSLVEKALNEKLAKAQAPGFKPGESVELTIQLPQDATYTDWKSAEDNNLLKCILCYLRAVDFLAARPEANPRRIKVNGASRSGPLAVIAAALRPANVCAVDAFVHTSAGISWEDKPYRGWGLPGGHNPSDPKQVRRLAQMAAYVDPVNHAPDVKCPIIFGYGADDDLSPPQGIEAMYHLAGSAWKRISRDAGGHQYSPGYQQLQKALDALLRE